MYSQKQLTSIMPSARPSIGRKYVDETLPVPWPTLLTGKPAGDIGCFYFKGRMQYLLPADTDLLSYLALSNLRCTTQRQWRAWSGLETFPCSS